jgi:sulfate adenylyltransferase subunit 1 (EFTu-like GTPase family)
MSKYKDIVKKNEQRYEKAKLNYMKLMEKLKVNQSYFKGIAQILNDNFTLSEYNCIYGVGAALIEIRRLWEKITK